MTGVRGVLWLLLVDLGSPYIQGTSGHLQIAPCFCFLLAKVLKFHLVTNLAACWLKALLRSISCYLVYRRPWIMQGAAEKLFALNQSNLLLATSFSVHRPIR